MGRHTVARSSFTMPSSALLGTDPASSAPTRQASKSHRSARRPPATGPASHHPTSSRAGVPQAEPAAVTFVAGRSAGRAGAGHTERQADRVLQHDEAVTGPQQLSAQRSYPVDLAVEVVGAESKCARARTA